MKKAIGYSRISDKEQSNYSLEGQKNAIISYCSKTDIDLLSVFEENGQSAKNFDRISWIQLENFIKDRHKDIDYLIVYKYDRFSRNLTEALAMIDKFEKKYKIIILSVLENLGVHPKSPMFIFFRTQLLLNANTELNYIKERTAFGLHNGAKSGRFLHTAPFGYKNARDENNKPIIVVENNTAALVQAAFKLFISGLSMTDTRKVLKSDGLTMKGNSAMRRLLSNPTYVGLIKVPSYYDEPEKLVEGKHEAIIDKATWWTVQNKLSGRTTSRQNNEEVPLRGALHCQCGRLMTAGNSKGRKKYYWYYVCLTCKENYSVIKLHNEFDNLLEELSLDTDQIECLDDMVTTGIEQQLEAGKKAIATKNNQLKEIEQKLESVQEKFFKDDIDKNVYTKWKGKYEKESRTLREEIENLQVPIAESWARYSEHLPMLGDMKYLYHAADINNKKYFIELVFDSSLHYHDNSYRTAYLIDTFALKATSVKEKGLLVIEQPLHFSSNFALSAPDGN